MFEQCACFVIVLGGGHNGDVHALLLVDLRIINLREDQLIAQAEGVVAASVERLGRDAAEVAHARQSDVHQAVEKFVHLVAAQGGHHANGHTFAHLECGDGFLRLGDDRLLADDRAHLVDGGIDHFGVLGSFTHAHVDHDLVKMRHRHGVLKFELLHERRLHFFFKFRAQASRALGPLFGLLLRRCCFDLFLFVLFICHFRFLSRTRVGYRYVRSSIYFSYLSIGASQCLQTRTLRSPLISCPMREGLPHEAQTSCTLETLIRLSCSAMPPLVLPCWAFTAFFIIMTCSTRIFPSSGKTRRTRPCLPLSRPVMTLTVSFFLMSIRCVSINKLLAFSS